MSTIIELIKSALYGVIEGITEWLPISSTGHMILFKEFLPLQTTTENFWDVFLVVIQLGAIMAVVILFWNKIFPFSFRQKPAIRTDVLQLWGKILVACVPAAVVGVLLDDWIDAHFYNALTVSAALILFGVLYLVVETKNKEGKIRTRVTTTDGITYRLALMIGIFQLIAAVFPGTSRSGATIVGALMLGLSRTAAAEFTFYLAIPVMFGASLLKLVKYGISYTSGEWMILAVGIVTAFAVSMICIRFLMNYIKKHDFRVFGWYRIALGALILILMICGVII